jgi:DNA-binding MarR family transcriptional regulator
MDNPSETIAQIRAFNRFYTDLIGLLDKYLPNSTYTLAEARTLYEIVHGHQVRASHITQALYIDKSYLSRILARLEKNRIITRQPSPEDARASILTLTAKGKKEYEALNHAATEQIARLLTPLSLQNRAELAAHMTAIRQLFQNAKKA